MNAPRHHTFEIAHIEVYGKAGEIVSCLRNLSTTGAFLELTAGPFLPQKGDLIRATVHLSTIKKTRVLNAEVVWTNDSGFGVTFIDKPELMKRLFSRGQQLSQAS